MRSDNLRAVIISGTCAAFTFGCATGESDDGDVFLTLTTQNPTSVGDGDGDRETGSDDHQADDTGDSSAPDPTCDDAEQNQMETDLDCGGPNCDPCANGFACVMNSDCLSDSCVGNVCIEPSCSDGVQNGDETDVDCGGAACDACEDNLGCAIAADCLSGVCSGGVCSPPACGDGVLNGSETDVDCGGTCPGCAEGGACAMDLDCLSQFCDANACAPADCLVDADCGAFNGDCTAGVCNVEKVCESSPVNQNGACDDGNLCTSGEVCSAGNCGGGVPLDCSQLSNACNVGVCNQNNGQCAQQSANDGNPCNDSNQCTVAEVCNIGECEDPNAPGYVFFEDFANNSAGWQLGTEWQIGAAAASNCAASCPGNDPATDHTPTNDNGIAGVVIGGCASVALHADYCITSPVINTAAMNTVWLTYWRHLHTDYSPYMVSTVQVYNGNTWQQVYTTSNTCMNDLAWTEVGHNVTAYKNANFRVRFCHNVGSNGAYTAGHWNIDDVTIGPAQCTPG
ncbi:hypothetical protein [Enhygromyxa salina]|uniref:MAM domain-containing protein n=1 Tax=Enhygromyxa salina TaxID=215803 RepID=A0A2S9Y4D3_9BACT|nr:hypothetical protein [Enhygromyxa salina]PRP99957.1 hypothetical protein ENSA7_61740 [Enhygromyxa salina]